MTAASLPPDPYRPLRIGFALRRTSARAHDRSRADALTRPVPHPQEEFSLHDAPLLARDRLRRLLAELDRRLDDPLEVLHAPGRTVAWVLGEVGYCVDHRARRVHGLQRPGAPLRIGLRWVLELTCAIIAAQKEGGSAVLGGCY